MADLRLAVAVILLGIGLACARLTVGTVLQAPDPSCVSQAEKLCSADAHCAAVGVFGDRIQLHGCVSTVPNSDWTLFIRGNGTAGAYEQVPGTVNVDEERCEHHPSRMDYTCGQPDQLFSKLGSIDVFTYENTIFYWSGVLYVLENIPCKYWGHAGIWDPTWGNHSYFRIRNLQSGSVVSNVTTSRGYGFVSAFTDFRKGVLWAFGTPADRCVHGVGHPTTVAAWWTTDLLHWHFDEEVFNNVAVTHNVQVSAVAPMPNQRLPFVPHAQSLPPHRYIMMLEPFVWAYNNNEDGNLTTGWVKLDNTSAPNAPSGGPCQRYNPTDGYYYILTGGRQVYLVRTRDFQAWETSSPSPLLVPSAGDAKIAPYANFSAVSKLHGSPPNLAVGIPEPYLPKMYDPVWTSNWQAWVEDNNDADFCCMHGDVNETHLVWGASTQGSNPKSPLDGNDAGTNSVGLAPMPLYEFLGRYFTTSK